MNNSSYLPEDFLEQLSTQYDIVLVEGNKQENKSQNIIFVGKENKQHIANLLVHHALQDKSIAVVLGEYSLDTILPVSQISKNITIINTASGLGSFAARGKRDRGDIAKAMSYGFEVYDPFSVEHLWEIVSRKSKKYIRFNQHLLSENQYPTIKSNKRNDIFNLAPLGFTGEKGVLLSLGSSILDLFHTATLLQEQGFLMDAFVTNRTDFSLSDELIASIRDKEELRIIADQLDNKLWEQSIKAKLREIGLFETDIHFISPRLEQVTSFLEEYVYEQAQMDGPGIAGRIIG